MPLTWTTQPGLGLFAGLGAALLIAYVFSVLAVRHTRKWWLYVAEAVGLALGAAVLLLLVKPWDAYDLYDGIRRVK